MATIFRVNEVNPEKWTLSKVRANQSGSKSVYVNFDNHRVNIQTPKMRLPFGISKNQWNDNDRPKYTVDLSFEKESNDKLDAFHKMLEDIDEFVMKQAIEHCKEWLGKNKLSKELSEELYNSVIRKYKDPQTKEFTGKYPDTLKLKLPQRNGKFMCKAFGPDKQEVDLEEALKPGAKVIAIMQISQIWISTMGFGVSLNATQLKVYPPMKLTGYSFLPDEDDELELAQDEGNGDIQIKEEDEDKEEEAEGEASKPEDNSDSEPEPEPEDNSDEDNSDEDSPEPAPKKRKTRAKKTAAKKTSKFSKKK